MPTDTIDTPKSLDEAIAELLAGELDGVATPPPPLCNIAVVDALAEVLREALPQDGYRPCRGRWQLRQARALRRS